MLIANATVYNSDDIYNLYMGVRSLCWRITEEVSIPQWIADAKNGGLPWERFVNMKQRPLPETLRIGYRTIKAKKKADDEPAKELPDGDDGIPSYVTSSGLYSKCPRFGIVKPEYLPVGPLLVLAHCAEGARREVPREIVATLARLFSRNLRASPSDDEWSYFVDDHEITFALSVSKEAKKAAKEATRLAKCDSLQEKIEALIDSAARLRKQADACDEQALGYARRLLKMQPKQEAK